MNKILSILFFFIFINIIGLAQTDNDLLGKFVNTNPKDNYFKTISFTTRTWSRTDFNWEKNSAWGDQVPDSVIVTGTYTLNTSVVETGKIIIFKTNNSTYSFAYYFEKEKLYMASMEFGMPDWSRPYIFTKKK